MNEDLPCFRKRTCTVCKKEKSAFWDFCGKDPKCKTCQYKRRKINEVKGGEVLKIYFNGKRKKSKK